jgi:hypothetical protein
MSEQGEAKERSSRVRANERGRRNGAAGFGNRAEAAE